MIADNFDKCHILRLFIPGSVYGRNGNIADNIDTLVPHFKHLSTRNREIVDSVS